MLIFAEKEVQWHNLLAIDLGREALGRSEKSSLRCIWDELWIKRGVSCAGVGIRNLQEEPTSSHLVLNPDMNGHRSGSSRWPQSGGLCAGGLLGVRGLGWAERKLDCGAFATRLNSIGFWSWDGSSEFSHMEPKGQAFVPMQLINHWYRLLLGSMCGSFWWCSLGNTVPFVENSAREDSTVSQQRSQQLGQRWPHSGQHVSIDHSLSLGHQRIFAVRSEIGQLYLDLVLHCLNICLFLTFIVDVLPPFNYWADRAVMSWIHFPSWTLQASGWRGKSQQGRQLNITL